MASLIYAVCKSDLLGLLFPRYITFGILNLIYYSNSVEINSCHLSNAFQYFIS